MHRIFNCIKIGRRCQTENDNFQVKVVVFCYALLFYLFFILYSLKYKHGWSKTAQPDYPLSGNCTSIIAPNIRTQPIISRKSILPPVMLQPNATSTADDNAANTDSKLIRIDADVGSVYFCPTICNVYAIPVLTNHLIYNIIIL